MLTFDAAALTLINQQVRGACLLVDAEFASGLRRITNYPGTVVTLDARTYLGVGQALDVSAINESEDTAPDSLIFSLSVADAPTLASAIGPASEYRGRAVRVHIQLLSEVGAVVGASVQRWSGYMDRISIDRDAEGGGGKIKVTCTKAGMARARRAEGLRSTHAQQQLRYPGDRGLEFIATLVEKPSVWLSKKFQEV